MEKARGPERAGSDWRLIRLRRAGTCHRCGLGLPQGVDAFWNAAGRALRCSTCHGGASPPAAVVPAEPLAPGEAGRSADREWQRRHDKRQARVLQNHPRVGRFLLALGDDPQSTTAWRTGAAGERRVAEQLAAIGRDDVVVLHDRRVPGNLSNIDHIVVGPAGVLVVDTKNYDGRLDVRDKGGFFKKDAHLYVGGRDRSRDAEAMGGQVGVITNILNAHDFGDVLVQPVLCFVAVQWPLFGRPRDFAGVRLTRPSELAHLVTRPGPLDTATVQRVAGCLAQTMKPA